MFLIRCLAWIIFWVQDRDWGACCYICAPAPAEHCSRWRAAAASIVGDYCRREPWLLKYNFYEILHRKERKGRKVKVTMSLRTLRWNSERQPSICVYLRSSAVNFCRNPALFLPSPASRHFHSLALPLPIRIPWHAKHMSSAIKHHDRRRRLKFISTFGSWWRIIDALQSRLDITSILETKW